MPVEAMQKVLIAGHKEQKDKIIKLLHRSQIIEISNNSGGSKELDAENLELSLADLQATISFIETHSGVKKSFIESFAPYKEVVDENQVLASVSEFDSRSVIKKIKDIENELNNIRNLETKIKADIALLASWQGLPFKLSDQSKLSRISITFGKVSHKILNKFKEGLKDIACEIYIASEIEGELHIAVIYPCTLSKEISQILSNSDFTPVTLPPFENSPKDEIMHLRKLDGQAKEQKAAFINDIKNQIKVLWSLKKTYDLASLRKQQRDIKDKFHETKSAFIITGWVKERDYNKLKQSLENLGKDLDIMKIAPEENEKVPTALFNPPAFRPFEFITRIFGVPGTSEIDPTQALSFFYLLFFAICLSDAAYGTLLAIGSYYLMKKLTLSEGGKNLLLLLFWGGILSIFVGIISGSYFSIDINALPDGAIKTAVLSAKLIDPIKNPLNMLIISLFLGVIQNLYGLAVGMYWKIKHGDIISGIFDFGFWIYFLSSLVFLLTASAAFPQYTGLAGKMSILGALLLFLTQARAEKGILKKAIFGLLSLYRTTSFLGDTLSYSRLLALMMTTAIIGTVINILALLTKDSVPILGYVIMAVVLIIGHVFNLVISVLGAFVHSMRLQLVEFFGKFYEGTGREFKPFKQETKYIIVR